MPEPAVYVRIPPFFSARANVARLRPSLVDTQTYKPGSPMNRQKKLQQLFKEKAKKASAKLAPKKPKYISKADRLKMAAEAPVEPVETTES